MADCIIYNFSFEKESFSFEINSDTRPHADDSQAPSWTELSFHKCPNCPFSESDCRHCPAAYDMHQIAQKFAHQASTAECSVEVITEERTYLKECSAQEGLASLLGLIMASSACPHLAGMKELAQRHLPFATLNETLQRIAGSFLLSQYMRQTQGHDAALDFTHLLEFFRDIHVVNNHLYQRIKSIEGQDSLRNSIYNFISFSELVEITFEGMLGESGASCDAFLSQTQQKLDLPVISDSLKKE